MGTSTSLAPGGFKETINEVGIRSVLGIRYAQLSNGERFAAPVAANGQLVVGRLAEVPVFPQLPSRLAAAMGTGNENPQTDDAFFLNVWAPENAVGLPVMVFVHGGAWMSGGGSNEWYEGSLLAAEGMVVVTVNYRIGPVAHLAPPGTPDRPLQDLALALEWVRENIGAFGGNPDEVTLAGQSAGAWYVHLLSLDPAARGLMRRVALLSMATREPWTRERLNSVRDEAARRLHPRTLENAETQDLLKAGVDALQETAEPRPLGHAASGYLPSQAENIPDNFLQARWCAQNVHVEEVLFSFTAQETGMFFFGSPEERTVTHEEVDGWISMLDEGELSPGTETLDRSKDPYERLVDISSWIQFQRFPTELTTAYTEQGLKTELVRLNLRSSQPGVLSGHCFDLPFWFGNFGAWADAPMLRGIDPEQFATESLQLRRGLARFVLGRQGCPLRG
ncbi:carboxylesterase family protein [Paeniglutamicibacter gangotriensis]|uniref:Carboxylic ester hydrolase n=1 Tax=Paeniglutamicibacter gangotriensis TaxID=254787 RepID=A0A5B0E8T5_9MICC|nr:carboxylesterase family protein [Paeniglutamicibacter gangotriensis]KAA0974170.1 carboxylesterase family protein [Paeniglutamicibacter gangotriensis]